MGSLLFAIVASMVAWALIRNLPGLLEVLVHYTAPSGAAMVRSRDDGQFVVRHCGVNGRLG
ncbi:hypothetical protein CQA77_30205, partial [Klebsiella pneumoniae]